MLHIVNKSHAQTTSLQSCLRLAKAGSALLLIEDAVYAATQAGAARLRHRRRDEAAQGLRPAARRRSARHGRQAGRRRHAVDYAGFVDLVAEHPNNQSWL